MILPSNPLMGLAMSHNSFYKLTKQHEQVDLALQFVPTLLKHMRSSGQNKHKNTASRCV